MASELIFPILINISYFSKLLFLILGIQNERRNDVTANAEYGDNEDSEDDSAVGEDIEDLNGDSGNENDQEDEERIQVRIYTTYRSYIMFSSR